MGTKSAKDMDRAKQQLEIAHRKKLEAIEQVAERARSAEVAMHAKKLLALDVAAERVAATAKARNGGAGSVGPSVPEKAGELATAVAVKASDVGEAVGAQAAVIADRAAQVSSKAQARVKQQPWIAVVAASVLLVALSISIARRYFSAAQ